MWKIDSLTSKEACFLFVSLRSISREDKCFALVCKMTSHVNVLISISYHFENTMKNFCTRVAGAALG